jgi:hypothetical protein
MDARQAIAVANTQAADQFNRVASENGWPILCDPYCRLADPRLCDAQALWSAKANGSIPYRKDMTARALQPFIPLLSIYERLPQPDGTTRWRVRLMGTEVALSTAEMTGKYIDEAISPEFLPRWLTLGETVLAHGGPLRILRRADSFGKQYIVGEEFTAPLLNDQGTADMTMGISSFENFDPWVSVEKKAREQLGLS